MRSAAASQLANFARMLVCSLARSLARIVTSLPGNALTILGVSSAGMEREKGVAWEDLAKFVTRPRLR